MEESILCLLGPVAIQDGRGQTPVAAPPKVLALLAYLALVGCPVERHTLARLLFPAASDPRATLRWHLSALRSAVPMAAAALASSRDTLALTIPTDVELFRQRLERVGRSPDEAEAEAILRLYRGDLLGGITFSAAADFDDWLYVEQEALRRLFRGATVAFARWALTNHQPKRAVSSLATLVSVDSYYEEGHVLLINTYAALGEQERAEAAYDRYQRTMRRELQSEPRTDVASRFEQPPRDLPSRSRDELIPLTEVTLHFIDWPGSAPAILGIHGSGLSSYSLTALAEQLSPGIRFIAMDLRGHGYSDKPPAGYDLEHHVADVAELAGALDLRRPVVLGHSVGGAIAAFVASRIDAGGLILLEAMIGDRAFTENAVARAAPIADQLDRRFAGFDAYRAEHFGRLRQGRWNDEAERLAARWVRFELAALPDGSYRRRALRQAVEAEWASIVAADTLGALRAASCPVLIVQSTGTWHGGQPYFGDEILAAQCDAAAQAERYVARDSDHGSLIRNPEPELIATIQHFVRQCAEAS